MTAEQDRLHDQAADWKQWGPYLSERAWGTVREDYSADGSAWTYFPHEHARFRAYRWNEDGLAGICDGRQRLCLAISLWNGTDAILKERLFGLSGPEGNHGEDVKEVYHYVDSTPTHSSMRMLYRYPQCPFPYADLVAENGRRTRADPEFELIDSGAFAENRYFDVMTQYAKSGPQDILLQIKVSNRGPDPAPITVAPTLWFRNTWSWREATKPSLRALDGQGCPAIQADHPDLGSYVLWAEGAEELLFTENETNQSHLYQVENAGPYTKDAFHAYLIENQREAVNPARVGTKGACVYRREVPAGGTMCLRLRLRPSHAADNPFDAFDDLLQQRRQEADQFYAQVAPTVTDPEKRAIIRQALAGMLWSKQYYHYNVEHWLRGDDKQPVPSPSRWHGRNVQWLHFAASDVLSMPDAWEYPWFAVWDLSFHCLTLALVDADFAKNQIDLLTREWFQHPNGQVPAYEWAFGDANPPVLAWAALRVYELEKRQTGKGDLAFLERVFHKQLLDFTWWVNRKDSEGNNIFEGGFLGLDNIGIFDRSAPLPTGGHIEQSDGTAWMGMYCLTLLSVCIELAATNSVYEDIASKFFDHFLFIAGAMGNIGHDGLDLWNEEDQFFYDVVHLPTGEFLPIKVRSFVGLIPLFAVIPLDPDTLARLPRFAARLEWFLSLRPDLAGLISNWHQAGAGDRRQLALVRGHRLKQLLKRALDPEEFLSPFGVRSLSKYHSQHPFTLTVMGQTRTVDYEPAESRTGTFGGNSNWRGPVWFPLNFLLIEALRRFHHYYGDGFVVECPTGSGTMLNLDQVATFLAKRLIALFQRGQNGSRPFQGDAAPFPPEPGLGDCLLFHEYFDGDTGKGLGASHQTGWTGLVATLIAAYGADDPQLLPLGGTVKPEVLS